MDTQIASPNPSGFIQYLVAVLSAATLGIVGYIQHLGTRVTTLETRSESQVAKDDDLKEFLEKLLDAKFSGLDTRLARIEANGNGHVRTV